MADDDKPKHTMGGEPESDREQPVAAHDPDGRPGERQDGRGTAPPRTDRTDAEPAGSTAARRAGPRQGTGSDDPFAAERGEPATFANGAAHGSGAGAGGGGAGESEEPETDSKGGGGGKGHR